jgi:hypothetical protein
MVGVPYEGWSSEVIGREINCGVSSSGMGYLVWLSEVLGGCPWRGYPHWLSEALPSMEGNCGVSPVKWAI